MRETKRPVTVRPCETEVFHQMAMRVVVETPFEEGGHIAETVSSLRELPYLHFTK